MPNPWEGGKVPYGSISGRAQAQRRARVRKNPNVQRHKKPGGCPLTALALVAGGAAVIGSTGYLAVSTIATFLS